MKCFSPLDEYHRLDYLCECLGLKAQPPGDLRYQLLHRTASAVIEAERFHATCAVMLVHSFSQAGEWFKDYARFLDLYGLTAVEGKPACLAIPDGIMLYTVWVKGNAKFLAA